MNFVLMFLLSPIKINLALPMRLSLGSNLCIVMLIQYVSIKLIPYHLHHLDTDYVP